MNDPTDTNSRETDARGTDAAEGASPEAAVAPRLGPTRTEVARLVIILVVLVALVMLLMAATQVNAGGCGGG